MKWNDKLCKDLTIVTWIAKENTWLLKDDEIGHGVEEEHRDQ